MGLKNPTIGIKNGNSKLLYNQVLEIRKLRKQGESITNLAKKFGVSYQHMWRIVNNKAWIV